MIVAKTCGLSLPKIYYSVAHVSYDSFALDGPPFETLRNLSSILLHENCFRENYKTFTPDLPATNYDGKPSKCPSLLSCCIPFFVFRKNYYIRAGFRDLSRGTRDFRSKPRSRSRPYTVIETELLRSRNLLSSMEMIRR